MPFDPIGLWVFVLSRITEALVYETVSHAESDGDEFYDSPKVEFAFVGLLL